MESRGLLERYELLAEIGQGAMGTVHRARDLATGAEVAVKRLRQEVASAINIARFRREIDILSRLDHPNILKLIDSGADGETPYFVTPLAHDHNLRVRLDRNGPLALTDALGLLQQVASALDYAHARNIMHRDLKPENILLHGAHVLLGDFGIARAIIMAASDARLSTSGMVLGTTAYMAPEQFLETSTVDERCDVYSLGCVAYELLAGEPPFTGVSGLVVQARHVSQPPPSLQPIRSDLPRFVDQAIAWALSKEAETRPRTAAAFVQRMAGELFLTCESPR
ncbi:MAG: serine/threonine-protein kinase [Gemmatimonadaceae bacterium]